MDRLQRDREVTFLVTVEERVNRLVIVGKRGLKTGYNRTENKITGDTWAERINRLVKV